VDTHFLRITKRLGLTDNDDPEKVEADAANLLPPERWSHFCHSVILHGRKTCKARKPNCDECRLTQLCPSAFKA
jgi:endonuclease-3